MTEEADDSLSEEADGTDAGVTLGVDAEDVIRDNAALIDKVKQKLASNTKKIVRHRPRKETLSYLREQFVSRLLSVSDMKARLNNDEYFDIWYENAQDLRSKDSNLDLDTARRIILRKHKAVLHKQLRDAIEKVQDSESDKES